MKENDSFFRITLEIDLKSDNEEIYIFNHPECPNRFHRRKPDPPQKQEQTNEFQMRIFIKSF